MLTHQPIKISGLGRYLPQRVVTNAELEVKCDLPAGWIAKHNGVLERRWADPIRESNSIMAAKAAKEAIAEAGLQLEEISCILNASGTQEQAIPDGGVLLQRALGLHVSGIPAMSIHTTCLSFISALQMAVGLFATQPYEHILITSAEIASLGLNFEEKESSTLIGDGAAAVVLSRAGADELARFEASRFETYSTGAHLTEILGGGSRRPPNSPETLATDNMFHMQGPAVLRTARKYVRGFLDRLRPGLSEGLDNIDFVIPHQASMVGLKILRYFNWPEEQVGVTLEKFGNCVAASIPMALYEMVRTKRIQRGDRLLLVGTGAGLSIGGVILVY